MEHYERVKPGLAGKHKVDLTEGVKHDKGKLDWSLLPPDALEDIIRVYEFGCTKYARDNWRKGLKYSRIFRAIMGHLWDWWRGKDINEEDGGVRHLAQAAWGCLTLLEYSRATSNNPYHIYDDRVLPIISLPTSQVSPSNSEGIITVTCPAPMMRDGMWYTLKDGVIAEWPNYTPIEESL